MEDSPEVDKQVHQTRIKGQLTRQTNKPPLHMTENMKQTKHMVDCNITSALDISQGSSKIILAALQCSASSAIKLSLFVRPPHTDIPYTIAEIYIAQDGDARLVYLCGTPI